MFFLFFFGYLDETTTHPNEEDRKHLSWSLYFNNVAGWKPVTLLKKKLRHKLLPVNFVKILRNFISKNTGKRLLL